MLGGLPYPRSELYSTRFCEPIASTRADVNHREAAISQGLSHPKRRNDMESSTVNGILNPDTIAGGC